MPLNFRSAVATDAMLARLLPNPKVILTRLVSNSYQVNGSVRHIQRSRSFKPGLNCMAISRRSPQIPQCHATAGIIRTTGFRSMVKKHIVQGNRAGRQDDVDGFGFVALCFIQFQVQVDVGYVTTIVLGQLFGSVRTRDNAYAAVFPRRCIDCNPYRGSGQRGDRPRLSVLMPGCSRSNAYRCCKETGIP